jgi:riboflavin biosynthesis pyrimidine reductase
VSADITTEDVLQIAREAGLTVDRKQAARFLRDDAHAHRMWKLMMEAGRQYIAESLEAEWVNESFPLSASKNRSSEEYDA